GSSTMVSNGEAPCSSAVAYTYTLNELPVCRTACVARLNFDWSKSYPPTIAFTSPVGLSMESNAACPRGCFSRCTCSVDPAPSLIDTTTTSPTFKSCDGDFFPVH